MVGRNLEMEEGIEGWEWKVIHNEWSLTDSETGRTWLEQGRGEQVARGGAVGSFLEIGDRNLVGVSIPHSVGSTGT